MTRIILTAAMPMLLGVSACGDHLGDYQLEDVRIVEHIPAEALDGGTAPSTAEYIRIEVSSKTSLYAAKTGPGLYTDADFCPLRDAHRLIAFGPIASDGKAVEDYKREEELRPERDGRYHYFVYVAPSSPPRKLFSNSDDVIPAYDVREKKGDVCLRFFVPGYNIIPSRSDTVRIGAETLARTTTVGTSVASGLVSAMGRKQTLGGWWQEWVENGHCRRHKPINRLQAGAGRSMPPQSTGLGTTRCLRGS